jgi:two-component system sensor kinase FixL
MNLNDITMILHQSSSQTTPVLRRNNALVGGYVVVYVLLDWMTYRYGITHWNPQAGLTLALLMVAGPRRSVWTAIAAVLAEVAVRGFPSTWLAILLPPMFVSGGYLLAADVLRRCNVSTEIESPEQVFSLVCVIVPVTLLVAILYVTLYAMPQLSPQVSLTNSIVRYWVGDMNGVLSLTPILIAARHWRTGLRTLVSRRLEVIGQFASIVIGFWIRLGQVAISDLIYVYPLFIPVIWIAFRWGVVGAAASAVIFQIALIVAANGYANESLLLNMQLLAVTMGAAALLLGSVVSSRTAALRRVAAQEAEQRAILTAAPDAVVATDAMGRIVSVNPAATQLFRLAATDLIGRLLERWLPKIKMDTTYGRASLEGLRGDSSSIPVDIAWARLDAPAADGFILIIRDVTDRLAGEALLRVRETELAKAMRFAAVGEFASALTHELNQPITALVSYLRASQILAGPVKDQDARLLDTLDKAALEAIRTSDVLRRLRDFYRGGTPLLAALDIEEVTTSVLKTYEDRLRLLGVHLHHTYETPLPAIMADRTQTEMILHNLLTNAIDAVADCAQSNREISVTASQRHADVIVAIEDSGAGVSSEIVANLFEPFVTTKPSGMGLGLAISRSLLRSHGGDLWAESGAFNGARFVVRMPITISTQTAL